MIEYEDLKYYGIDLVGILDTLIENDKLLEEVIRACISKKGYSKSWTETLVSNYKKDVAEMLRDVKIRELVDLISKAQLDLNWMVATVSLAIQDISTQNMAMKLQIPIQRADGGFKNTPQLLGEIESKIRSTGIQVLDLRVAKEYSDEYRNKVIHRGEAVDKDRAFEILRTTENLLKTFSKICEKA